MNKRKKIEHSIVWLLATYIAMHLTLSGHFSLQFDPSHASKVLYGSLALLIVAAEPEDSLGDGPGNR